MQQIAKSKKNNYNNSNNIYNNIIIKQKNVSRNIHRSGQWAEQELELDIVEINLHKTFTYWVQFTITFFVAE